MITTVLLSAAQRAQIAAAARAAAPRECCGLLEGVRDGEAVRVAAVHPTRNLSQEADRFAIDPAEQFALLRRLRGTGRAVVGCYHSHPDGRAEPSPRDLAAAAEEGFVWLIAGHGLAGFVFRGGRFAPLFLAENRA